MVITTVSVSHYYISTIYYHYYLLLLLGTYAIIIILLYDVWVIKKNPCHDVGKKKKQ